MSRRTSVMAILVMALMILFTVSCEGPAGKDGADGMAGLTGAAGINGTDGADGADGADGIDGIDGTDGTDGVDGNATCLTCHNLTNKAAVTASYDLSGHAAGGAVDYAGNRTYCAPCHSHELFTEATVDLGGNVAAATPISCATCHDFHATLDFENDGADYALRATAAVVGIADGLTYDFGGSSNLCANCHQSRRAYTYYSDIDSVWTDDVNGNDSLDFVVHADSVYISSSHAGPHHGPQANAINGNGGYGTSVVPSHASSGCTGCHMEGEGLVDGGHTFTPTVASCNTAACHNDAVTSFDHNGKQTDFDTRMAALAEALVTAGALSGDATDGYHPHVGIVHEDVFTAFWNYMVLYEDGSRGIHNPGYFANLLTMAELSIGL